MLSAMRRRDLLTLLVPAVVCGILFSQIVAPPTKAADRVGPKFYVVAEGASLSARRKFLESKVSEFWSQVPCVSIDLAYGNDDDSFVSYLGPRVGDAVAASAVIVLDLSHFPSVTAANSDFFLAERILKFSEVVGYRYVTRGDGRVSDAMKYALKEILKNAVAYGNKFDLSVPIFVRIDPQTFSVAVLNGVSPSRPLRKDELLRAGLGGFGKAMRYLASLCGYKYSLQKEATWAYAKAEFPRDVVAGGGASLIAHISRVQQAYLDSRRDSRGKLQKISVLDFIAVNYICSLPGPGLYSLTGQGIFTTARWQFRACSIHGRWLFPLEKFFYDTVFSKWLPFLAVSECSVSPFARWILKRAIDADSYAVIVTKSGSCR